MKTTEEKIVNYDSEEAAQYKTGFSGWVDRFGRYWGTDEHMARYSGSTHKNCECGSLVVKSHTRCDKCQRELIWKKYLEMPFVEWDGSSFVYSDDHDRYFRDSEEAGEFCADEDFEDGYELYLIICEPNEYSEISYDIWEEVLPEDGDIHPELEKRIEELNKFIATLPPASYGPGKKRTTYVYDKES